MDILDILLDILLKPLQPLMGLFLCNALTHMKNNSFRNALAHYSKIYYYVNIKG